MIEVNQVHVVFEGQKRGQTTLHDVSLKVNPGEFICLLGPSGCGKSTLLNLMAGFLKPTQGEVLFEGRPVQGPDQERAVIFQESALFPWMSVQENVAFGLKIAGIKKKEREEIANSYLKMVHLLSFKDARIHELSGGMKQRVSIARALALNTKVLLMDEAFAALDSQTREILQLEIQRIHYETKQTIVFVTHNIEEAVLLADRVIVMGASPGRILRDIPIQLARPRQIDSIDLTYVIKDVMKVLKEEVEKVAKAEYDNQWHLQEDSFFGDSSSDMGAGL